MTSVIEQLGENIAVKEQYKDWSKEYFAHIKQCTEDFKDNYSNPKYNPGKEDNISVTDLSNIEKQFPKSEIEDQYKQSLTDPKWHRGVQISTDRQSARIRADERAYRTRHCSVPNILLHGQITKLFLIGMNLDDSLLETVVAPVREGNTQVKNKFKQDGQ